MNIKICVFTVLCHYTYWHFTSQWHRIIENTQDLEKGGSRRGEKYLPQLQAEWNFDMLGKSFVWCWMIFLNLSLTIWGMWGWICLYSELQGEKRETWRNHWFLLFLKCVNFIVTVYQERAFLRKFQNLAAMDFLNIGWKCKGNFKLESGIRNFIAHHSAMKF